MDFNTLEIIGLAFLSGLHISEMVEDLKEEENEEQEENKTEKRRKRCRCRNTRRNGQNI